MARGCSSIYDVIPEVYQHAQLCLHGRLDVDTTGLILLGTDGGLQSLLMHPTCECQKVYIATLRVDPNKNTKSQIRGGKILIFLASPSNTVCKFKLRVTFQQQAVLVPGLEEPQSTELDVHLRARQPATTAGGKRKRKQVDDKMYAAEPRRSLEGVSGLAAAEW